MGHANSTLRRSPYELGMQIPQRNVLQQTEPGMRPRRKRLRAPGPIQFPAKREREAEKF